MDLRVKKTERAIRNAFFQLIQEKPLEKITVKEISELAEINKTTFYAHYDTLYDLAETLERETIDSVIANLDGFFQLFDDPRAFVYDMYDMLSFYNTTKMQAHLSPGQSFSHQLSQALVNKVKEQGIHPEDYGCIGTLLVFLINGLIGLRKSSPDGLPTEELDYLADFVAGGIRSLPPLDSPSSPEDTAS